MGKANIDLRLEIVKAGLSYRDVAEEMHISQEWLSRVLARRVTPDMRRRINNAIDELSACRRTDRRRVQQ